ncbi:MAG TPA: MoaD/ThiS family protein [Acidimicrobiales bacterium]|nr:MoaD/ThiS family protein [Acidimicrobiales bacterium]
MALLRFFGPLRELTRTSHLEIEAQHVDDAIATVVNLFGEDVAKIMTRSRVWVNGEPSEGTRRLGPGDEVAILPPVSGG